MHVTCGKGRKFKETVLFPGVSTSRYDHPSPELELDASAGNTSMAEAAGVEETSRKQRDKGNTKELSRNKTQKKHTWMSNVKKDK